MSGQRSCMEAEQVGVGVTMSICMACNTCRYIGHAKKRSNNDHPQQVGSPAALRWISRQAHPSTPDRMLFFAS